MGFAMFSKPTAGLVIRSKDVELLVMQGREVMSCLHVPIEGNEDADLIAAIQKAVATSGMRLDRLAVSLQSRDVLFRFFTMPMVPKAEWDTAVQFEARKYNPFKTESLIWDYRAKRSDAGNQLDVIFSAIPKENFQHLQGALAAAGVQPTLIEPHSLSLARLVESARGAPANEFTCVVDVESDAAHLAIVKRRIPYLTRDANLLSPSGLVARGEETAAARAPEGAGAVGMVDPKAQRLLSELNVSMSFFLREYPSTTIPRVLLCGDERLIGPWCRWLSDQLHCAVELGVSLVEQRVRGGLPLSFASAVGLLQGAREPSVASIDFRRRALAKAPSAQRSERGEGRLAELLAGLNTPHVMMGATVAMGFLAACWIATSMMLSNGRAELAQLVRSRPDVGWGLSKMTETELAPIQEKAKSQVALLGQIIDQRLSVTGKLDALARSLPNGVWLTELAFDNPLDLAGKSQPRLKVNGACFLGEAGRELTAIQKLEEEVKRNGAFFSGFTEARLDQIGAGEQAEPQYSYRTFQLNCSSVRKL